MIEPIVIAILGMAGSGKTEAIEYLRAAYKWPKVYFGDINFREMERLGLPPTQENERFVREKLRDEHGEDYHAREIVRMIDDLGDVPVVLVESLYSAVERQVLKQRFGDRFRTIAIHARPSVRYERLSHRPERPLTPTEAAKRDESQLSRLTQGTPIALSDIMIVNEGSREELHMSLDRVVQELNSR